MDLGAGEACRSIHNSLSSFLFDSSPFSPRGFGARRKHINPPRINASPGFTIAGCKFPLALKRPYKHAHRLAALFRAAIGGGWLLPRDLFSPIAAPDARRRRPSRFISPRGPRDLPRFAIKAAKYPELTFRVMATVTEVAFMPLSLRISL